MAQARSNLQMPDSATQGVKSKPASLPLFAFLHPIPPRLTSLLRQELKVRHTRVQQVLIKPKPISAHHIVDQIWRRESLRHCIRASGDINLAAIMVSAHLPSRLPRVETLEHLAQTSCNVPSQMSLTGRHAIHQLNHSLDESPHLSRVDAEIRRVPIDGDLQEEDGGEGHHGMSENGHPNNRISNIRLLEHHVQACHGGRDGNVGRLLPVHGEDRGICRGKPTERERVELEFGKMVVQDHSLGGIRPHVRAVG